MKAAVAAAPLARIPTLLMLYAYAAGCMLHTDVLPLWCRRRRGRSHAVALGCNLRGRVALPTVRCASC